MTSLTARSPARIIKSTTSLRPQICQACCAQLSRPSSRYASTDSNESFSREDHRLSNTSQPTWHNLQWVGSKKYIWENTRPIKKIERWAPHKAVDLEKLESQLLCTLVETLLLFDGQDVSRMDMSKLPIRSENDFNQLFPEGVSVSLDRQGRPSLDISTAQRDTILGFQRASADVDEVEQAAEQSREEQTLDEQASENQPITSWRSVPLQSLSLRFAFLKRLFQRTGHRISDSTLSACTTVGAVHSFLLAQHASKRKLAQELQDDDQGFGLKDRANVALKTTRFSRVDRDMSVGRWKLTRKALADAGLPEFWRDPPLSKRRRNTAFWPERQPEISTTSENPSQA